MLTKTGKELISSMCKVDKHCLIRQWGPFFYFILRKNKSKRIQSALSNFLITNHLILGLNIAININEMDDSFRVLKIQYSAGFIKDRPPFLPPPDYAR